MGQNNLISLGEILDYLKKVLRNSQTKFLYGIFLLFYAYKNSDTPSWAKNIIIGSIGYVLSPIDAIPDLTPFLGMTDDIGVLSFGITSIACYIDKEVRSKSKEKIHQVLGEAVNETCLVEVDRWL